MFLFSVGVLTTACGFLLQPAPRVGLTERQSREFVKFEVERVRGLRRRRPDADGEGLIGLLAMGGGFLAVFESVVEEGGRRAVEERHRGVYKIVAFIRPVV